MKDIVKFFSGRRYSAVRTNDFQANSQLTGSKKQNHKSLQTKPKLQGLPVIDVLFHDRKHGERARWPKCIFFLLTTGLLLTFTGILILIIQPYDIIFKWKLLMNEEDGEIFDMWAKPPVDLFLKVYLFNITNADDFMEGRDEKLRVEEIGPYVYRELMSHENVTFNDNGTMSIIPHHPLEWRGDLSNGRSEEDILYLPNIALLSIAQVVAQKSFIHRLPVNVLIRKTESQPIVKMTAKEFMLGYESPLIRVGNTLLPHWIYFDKVGLIDRMYDFTGDFSTFYTGENDISTSGLYDTFRGSPNLPQWDGEYCSNIRNASDGTKFKSFIEEDEQLLFFRKSMCRPQRLVKADNAVVKVQGLEGIKFKIEENALDNGIHNEANKCYCRGGKCLTEGLIDVTDCYYGFPIALSYPHFLDGSPSLLENVTGCTPNRSLHESSFIINPTSGLPLRISAKFQINMAMSDISNMAHVQKFSHLTIPMLWFEIALDELPDRLEKRFKLYLKILPLVEKVGLYGSFILGGILSIFAVFRVALRTSRTITGQQRGRNMTTNNSVYQPCEEKLMDNNHSQRSKPDDDNRRHDDDQLDDKNKFETFNVITRDQFELEDDDALSDIDYKEVEEESTSNCSDQSGSNTISIDLTTSEESEHERSMMSQSPTHLLETRQNYPQTSRREREEILKIIESDDDT